MISIPRYLARGLDVRTGERAVAVNVQNGGWEKHATESGTRENGAALLLTAPILRSLTLVETGNLALLDETRHELESISYAPCLALLALLDGPTGVPEPASMQIKGEPLDWIGDNQRKGISAAPGVTIPAGPQWSREYFEGDEAKATAQSAFLRRRAISLRPLLLARRNLPYPLAIRLGHAAPSGPCLVASEEPSSSSLATPSERRRSRAQRYRASPQPTASSAARDEPKVVFPRWRDHRLSLAPYSPSDAECKNVSGAG
jgi:hypothetical protein